MKVQVGGTGRLNDQEDKEPGGTQRVLTAGAAHLRLDPLLFGIFISDSDENVNDIFTLSKHGLRGAQLCRPHEGEILGGEDSAMGALPSLVGCSVFSAGLLLCH